MIFENRHSFCSILINRNSQGIYLHKLDPISTCTASSKIITCTHLAQTDSDCTSPKADSYVRGHCKNDELDCSELDWILKMKSLGFMLTFEIASSVSLTAKSEFTEVWALHKVTNYTGDLMVIIFLSVQPDERERMIRPIKIRHLSYEALVLLFERQSG